MLGRGNWNLFTFRALKNNVKLMTMRGGASGTVWTDLGREAQQQQLRHSRKRQEEERRDTRKNLQCTFTSFSLSSATTPKANAYAERRMKCGVSSGQTRVHVHETLAESVCTFLKWASMSGLLSHISVRRTTDVWRTPAEQADGQRVRADRYTLNHHCFHVFRLQNASVCAQGGCEERETN